MELYVFITFAVMVVLMVCVNIITTIMSNRYKNDYIKNVSFLLMENAGPDPCEKEQKIDIKHHYIQPSSWISEVQQ